MISYLLVIYNALVVWYNVFSFVNLIPVLHRTSLTDVFHESGHNTRCCCCCCCFCAHAVIIQIAAAAVVIVLIQLNRRISALGSFRMIWIIAYDNFKIVAIVDYRSRGSSETVGPLEISQVNGYFETPQGKLPIDCTNDGTSLTPTESDTDQDGLVQSDQDKHIHIKGPYHDLQKLNNVTINAMPSNVVGDTLTWADISENKTWAQVFNDESSDSNESSEITISNADIPRPYAMSLNDSLTFIMIPFQHNSLVHTHGE